MNKNIFYDMLLNKLKNTDYKSYYSNTINGFDLIFEDKEFEKILKTPVKIMVSKSTQTCKLDYEYNDSSDTRHGRDSEKNSSDFDIDCYMSSDEDIYEYHERKCRKLLKLLHYYNAKKNTKMYEKVYKQYLRSKKMLCI